MRWGYWLLSSIVASIAFSHTMKLSFQEGGLFWGTVLVLIFLCSMSKVCGVFNNRDSPSTSGKLLRAIKIVYVVFESPGLP